MLGLAVGTVWKAKDSSTVVEVVSLTGHGAPAWVRFQPAYTSQPGEHELVLKTAEFLSKYEQVS